MPSFLHPSWILGTGSGHRTPASTAPVPRTLEIVLLLFPFFIPAGTDLALLAVVPCWELVLRWFSSWPQIPFPKFSTYPSRAPLEVQPACVVPRLVISHSVTPKHFSFYQVQHFLSVSVTVPKLLSQLWGAPSLTLKLLLKMGNNRKTKNQGMHLLDGGSLSTIRFGHAIKLSFSLFNV